jgi:hypothetical protein
MFEDLGGEVLDVDRLAPRDVLLAPPELLFELRVVETPARVPANARASPRRPWPASTPFETARRPG